MVPRTVWVLNVRESLERMAGYVLLISSKSSIWFAFSVEGKHGDESFKKILESDWGAKSRKREEVRNQRGKMGSRVGYKQEAYIPTPMCPMVAFEPRPEASACHCRTKVLILSGETLNFPCNVL